MKFSLYDHQHHHARHPHAQGTTSDAECITRALGGKWTGCQGIAICPAHDDHHPSLSIAQGDDGRLLMYCYAGCSFPAICGVLRHRGLLDGTGDTLQFPEHERTRQKAEREKAMRKRSALARICWDEAQAIANTPAERYLRRRGITCALPANLRFHPAAWHAQTAQRLPAMIACIDAPRGFAVHRTYLKPDGSAKAAVTPTKTMLGPTRGGAVKLSRGPGPLVVAEGIETALSLACGLLPRSMTLWSALSAPGLSSLHLPASPGHIIIATDGDLPGRKAGDALAMRASALDWTVEMFPAADGRDWNDELLRMKGGV
ncbi:DUF7146 domain-containing protein [Paenirhodobacter hankyongi]|uniref:Uncharacterized protein n=1 Tax=Paenirhodobacter hankyongi TaxID=2294033 RepID=A0A421BXJ1_9RHOB|nr:toprim domain-containing protein [Sinirhodobacter hankyongi]RLL73047.1 hypothetical protein DYS74_01650 [Sinirhodobacter hankyongi]